MLRNHGESLNDESLCTLLVEVEGIINSRPITCESISNVNSIIPMSPMQLLGSKTRVVMPPPGTFRKKACTVENMFTICQMNFGHDGGRKCLQHVRLGKSGTRPSETSK